jgi:hypothetical protein
VDEGYAASARLKICGAEVEGQRDHIAPGRPDGTPVDRNGGADRGSRPVCLLNEPQQGGGQLATMDARLKLAGAPAQIVTLVGVRARGETTV